MADTKKVTKKDYFNAITAYLQGEDTTISVEDMLAFVEHEVELLSKKNATKKPNTKNDGVKADILAVLATGDKFTVTEIIKANPTFVEQEMSTQKISAILKLLENDGKVVKTTDKKKSYYSIVED